MSSRAEPALPDSLNAGSSLRCRVPPNERAYSCQRTFLVMTQLPSLLRAGSKVISCSMAAPGVVAPLNDIAGCRVSRS